MHRNEKAVTLQSSWWWSSSTYSSLVISFSVINYVVSVSFCAWGVITQRFKKVLIESKGFFVFYTASSSCWMFRQKLEGSGKNSGQEITLRHSLVHDKTFSTHVVWENGHVVSKSGVFTHERWAFSGVVPSQAGAHFMTLESGGDPSAGLGHTSFFGSFDFQWAIKQGVETWPKKCLRFHAAAKIIFDYQ